MIGTGLTKHEADVCFSIVLWYYTDITLLYIDAIGLFPKRIAGI